MGRGQWNGDEPLVLPANTYQREASQFGKVLFMRGPLVTNRLSASRCHIGLWMDHVSRSS